MEKNPAYFSFFIEDKSGEHLVRDVYCVFKPDGYLDKHAFIELIVDDLKSRPVIDDIIILIPCAEQYELIKIIKNDSLFLHSFDRHPKASVIVTAYDDKGELIKNEVLRPNQTVSGKYKLTAKTLYKHGLAQLCQENQHVLQNPPSNCIFIKPSGKSHNKFIRASQLFANDAQLSFVALTLLKYFDLDKHKYIFIDSMSISPLVYRLIDMKIRLSSLEQSPNRPQIVSFHSYKGIKDGMHPPEPTRTLVIISASTSGIMATELKEEWNLEPKSIITILSFFEAKEGTVLLHKLEESSGANIEADELIPVEIKGEYFMPRYRKPKLCLIRSRHAPRNLRVFMQSMYSTDILSASKDGQKIFADAIKLINHEEFNSWFENTLKRVATLDVSHIVHTDDEASRKLAEKTQKYYIGKLTKEPQIVCETEVLSNTCVWSSAIVTTAVASSGSRLLSISRDLRDKAKGAMNVFLVGMYLPACKEQSDSFKSSMTYSAARAFKHRFETWSETPIGINRDEDAWGKERDYLQDARFEDVSEIKGRLIQLRNPEGLRQHCFWSTPKGDQLRIRQDFNYWAKDFNTKNAKNNANVLYTVSCLLQYARDINDPSSLSGSEYQAVILAPENFARFNDGVIQASLLRAALPRELNYKVAPEASKEMTSLLIKMARNHTQDVAEALPEFFVALATKRMILIPEDYQQLLDEIDRIEGFPTYFRTILPNETKEVS